MDVRFLDIQGARVRVIRLDETFRQRMIIFSQFVRCPDDLIVDVREVRDVFDLISAICEVATDRIEDDGWTCVADMNVVVYRRATDIHLDLSFF